MGRILSPWCKSVKIAMIEKNMSTRELAEGIDMAREYTSAVVNGRVISESAAKTISDYLGIELTELTLTAPK